MADQPKRKPRKPVSAAFIRVEMVFTSDADFQRFGKVKWGRESRSVTGRRWVSARWEDPDEPESVIAVFEYVHTCRNDGAQRSDSLRFFKAVCRTAGVSLDNAGVLNVELMHRIKCVEPETLEPAVKPAVNAAADRMRDWQTDREHEAAAELERMIRESEVD